MNDRILMLWFSMVPKVSLNDKLRILEIFDNIEDIYNATKEDFINKGYFKEITIQSILSSKNLNYVLSYKSELDKKRISFVNLFEEDYPYLLKNIFDPPILIYYKGTLPKNNKTLVSVVGTRAPSSYGQNVTYKVTKSIVQENIGVVSGLAYGIDTIANSVAIENKGYTVAVLGSGIDTCYPKSNINLLNKISSDGLVISEYGLGYKPYASNFPARNRIIAGLSTATIVTEAPIKSGSLITARLALSEGRDVLTVPADIFRRKSQGNNILIKEGATPITCSDDIFFAINHKKQHKSDISNICNTNENYNKLSYEEKEIINYINYNGVLVDELSVKTNLSVSKIQTTLTILEINGIIKKLPNGKFIKI